jgi:ABC-type dipeptide/oligopeptide/nickel transport system permease subunit
VTIGLALGMLAGYFRGPVDATISLFINFLLSFPRWCSLLRWSPRSVRA